MPAQPARSQGCHVDYSVSDLTTANTTAPNQPLYNPRATGVPAMSVNQTLCGYLDQGVPANKMVAGLAMYGHSWYVKESVNEPALAVSGAEWWQRFGLRASVSGECFGPFKRAMR